MMQRLFLSDISTDVALYPSHHPRNVIISASVIGSPPVSYCCGDNKILPTAGNRYISPLIIDEPEIIGGNSYNANQASI